MLFMVTKNVLGWGPDLLGSCASLRWRWHVLVSAGSHTGWLGKDLLGKHTRALFLWCHWTHTHTHTHYIQSSWADTHTSLQAGTQTAVVDHLLLSQNLMMLFWLLCLWVSIIRLKSVSFCSCPSISIRPRKNQWRLCSLGRRAAR